MEPNTFQESLITYAGFTGMTGGIYAPTVLAPGAAKMTLAGSATITGVTGQIDIALPASATEITVIMRNMASSGTIGVFIVAAGNNFGVDITPSSASNQQFYLTAMSPNSLTWVGTASVGPINTTTEGKTEMLAGVLLTPLLGVSVAAGGGGDFSAGSIWVFYT